MILPDKNIKLEYSLLNCGATILSIIEEPQTISSLWNKAKKQEILVSYEKFLLCLDYLYTIKAINLRNGLIERYQNDLLDKKQ
jgi:hypothetical protein